MRLRIGEVVQVGCNFTVVVELLVIFVRSPPSSC
jgi:hypothetical protein